MRSGQGCSADVVTRGAADTTRRILARHSPSIALRLNLPARFMVPPNECRQSEDCLTIASTLVTIRPDIEPSEAGLRCPSAAPLQRQRPA
jgi:hypothetical protein